MTVPEFPHPGLESFTPRAVPRNFAPEVPAMPGLEHHPGPGRAGFVRAVEMPGAAPPRRQDAGLSGAEQTFLAHGGTLPVPEPIRAPTEAARRLARAQELLSRQPDAVARMKRKVLETFAALLEPPGRQIYYMGPPPILRMSVELHRLRLDLLAASTAEEQLVLLVDAEAALRDMRPYSEDQSTRMAAEDKSRSVAMIGSLFNLTGIGPNEDLSTDFFDGVVFDDADVDEPAEPAPEPAPPRRGRGRPRATVTQEQIS